MTILRGFILAIALGLAACAMTPPPAPLTTQSLLDNMRVAPRPTEQSCAAANMALVCASSTFSRARKVNAADNCSCADRTEAKLGSWR